MDLFQVLRRSLSKLCQQHIVRSLVTSVTNKFIRDKSYVNGKWVAASSGKTFDGKMFHLHTHIV